MKEKERRVVLSLISIFVFVLVLILVILKKTFVDSSIGNFVINVWNPTTNGFFIFLGEYSQMIMIGIAIAIIILLYPKKRKQSLIFAFILITGYILEKVIKLIVQRDRPVVQLFQETGYSFPSGHAVFSMILFSMLIYFYKDEIKNNARRIIFISIGVFLIILVGFSRIYLNVHWFTDVIGGYALGLFLVNIGILILRRKKVDKLN